MFQSNLGLIMVKIECFGEKVRNFVPVLSPFRQARVVARRDEHAFIARQASNLARHNEGTMTLCQASNPTRHGEGPVDARQASIRARHSELCCDRMSLFPCLRSVSHETLRVEPWLVLEVNYSIIDDL